MTKSETATTNAYHMLHKMALKVSILTSTELYQSDRPIFSELSRTTDG